MICQSSQLRLSGDGAHSAEGALSRLPNVSRGSDRAKRRVLVVDDDPLVRALASKVLGASGFEVTCAENGTAALECFSEQPPALVLCDVMMPGVNGFEVCGRLREHPEMRRIPFVMFTVLDDPESIERAFEVGATEFIVKPISWKVLPRRLHHILRTTETVDALRQSEERFALAALGANDGLWDWDLAHDTAFYSSRWRAMLGCDEAECASDPSAWFDRIHPDDRARVQSEIDAHLQGKSRHFESEHRMRTENGDYLWVMSRGVALRQTDGTAYRMAGSQTDISARKEIEAQLIHDAIHDNLTGLANRSLFLDRLLHAIQVAQRHPEYRFAVLFMDLDRFKVVNDSLGHIKGDQLLVEVSRRLQGILRRGDTLARLGGDEFVFLIEDIPDIHAVTHLATRIQEVLATPISIDEQRIVSSASMGIALNTADYERPEDMLRDADAAMYRAKANGRGGYTLFNSEIHSTAFHVLQLETELRAGLDRDEFFVEYQPIVALSGGRIAGLEALLRWRHPERGRLLPNAFLGVAMDTRLIVPIGRRLLSDACNQLANWRRQWPQARDWFMSVNLSGRELAQPDLVDAVDRVLAESALPGGCLEFEVTESSLVTNNETALEVMTRLRERDVRFSIDDFGTGYSSFNYLHQFPFDTLKIDRSFVRDLNKDPRGRKIVETVIALAHNLGLKVVAEGSETSEIQDTLATLPCEFAQGYSIVEPITAEAITGMLRGGDEPGITSRYAAAGSGSGR